MRKFILFLLTTLSMIGCTPTEKLKYVINTEESKNEYTSVRSEKKIQPYDYLYIKLFSLDPKTSEIFNGPTSQQSDAGVQLQSYEVDYEGFISFPFVGRIQVKDLTIEEAQVKLEKELTKYLSNISLRVRFVGNKITVVGEVTRPGNLTFFDEKINVFQALGLAGDVAVYGDKTNITLLREKDNKTHYVYLDLTDKSIVGSEYYFLQPNDVLIVNPVRQKYRQYQDRSLIFAVITSISSLTMAAYFYNQIK